MLRPARAGCCGVQSSRTPRALRALRLPGHRSIRSRHVRRAVIGSLPPLETGGRFSIGSRRQEFLMSFRKAIEDVRYGPSPFLVVMAGRESSPFFAQGPNGVNIKVDLPLFSEQLLQVGYDVPNGDNWIIQVGPVLRHWRGGLTSNTKSATPLGLALRVDEGNEKEHM